MSTLRVYLLSFAACCALAASIALSQTSPEAARGPGTLSETDQMFVSAAREIGAAEVAMAELAKDRATSPDVREFAFRIIFRNLKAEQQLKAIATSKGGQVNDPAPGNDQSAIERLRKMEGVDFDKAYLQAQLSAQEREMMVFLNEALNGDDGVLKQFASSTLTTLEGHLDIAEELTNERTNAAPRPSRIPGVDLREA